MIQNKQRKAQNQGKKNKNTGSNQLVPLRQSQMEYSKPPVSFVSESAYSPLAPQMSVLGTSNSDLRIRVRHREYFADVLNNASASFLVSRYPINPGISSSFPWLSRIAGNFESYRFNSLSFEYRTGAPTSYSGKVVVNVDWDASDAAPTSKFQMLQERTKIDGPIWANLCLPCDRQDLLKFGTQRYIRQGLIAGTDIKTYDVGNLHVGIENVNNTLSIGELYVSYDVELITPSTNPDLGAELLMTTGASTTSIFQTITNLFGSSVAKPTTDGSGLVFTAPGRYLVRLIGDAVSYVLGAAPSGLSISDTKSGTGFLSFIVDVANGYFQPYTTPNTLAISATGTGPFSSELNVAAYPIVSDA